MYSGAQTKSEREGIDSVREEGRALNWRTPKNAVQIPFPTISFVGGGGHTAPLPLALRTLG